MTRDYAGEIRARMDELGRMPRPRHARLVGDPGAPYAICRILHMPPAGTQIEHVFTFGLCRQEQWIANDINDRRIRGWMADHGFGWPIADDGPEAHPLLVSTAYSDGEAALALENQITGMKRWLRRNGTERLIALARFVDEGTDD